MTRVKVGRDGFCSLAHPMAELGEQPSGATIWLVEGVPPGTPAEAVLRLFEGTVLWTAGRYRLRFDELRPGGLVR